jgi:fucose permease
VVQPNLGASTPLTEQEFTHVHKPISSQTRIILIAIGFFSYIAIGLPGGVLGVAWPSIRDTFSLSLDAVAALFIAHTAGYFLAGYLNGQLVLRLGIGRLMALACVISGVGMLGCALAPSWAIMVACALLGGLGMGAIDAGMNTYFAAVHSASLMNWLHAFFGLGATISPAITTALLDAGQVWRWSYAIVAATLLLAGLLFALTWNAWQMSQQETQKSASNQVRALDTLRLPAAWLGILMFLFFTGLEAAGGQWPYTLFTEGRGIDPTAAGLWVSVYWASLTVGRILFGIIATRIGTTALLRLAMLGCILGAALIWTPAQILNLPISFLGLALLGFFMAPLFPLSISDTPHLVGKEHAANAIGFQISAASLGFATLPGLAGFMAERLGLEIIGPVLVVLAVAMFLLHEAFVRSSTHREAQPGK